MIRMNIDGSFRMIPEDTVLERIAPEYQGGHKGQIVLATVNGKLQELTKKITKPGTIRFVGTDETAGHSTYERSAMFLLNKAIYSVIPLAEIHKVSALFSVTGGVYVQIDSEAELNQKLVDRIRQKMQELVDADLPFFKKSVSIDEAIEFFHRVKMYDKERLFRYRRSSSVNLYALDGFCDYNYGYMVPSSGYIRYFDITLYQGGIVLLLPEKSAPSVVAELKPQDKLFQVMIRTKDWGKKMKLSTVGDVNEMIADGKIEEMILVTEARQEAEIAGIARQIAENPEKRIVLIAGPSSSGKTSFSHRLSIQLKAQGLNPHPIGVDDYFVDREFTPIDENGKLDFESLECVDVKQFNADMNALLQGEKVQLPSFNFIQGKREYKGNYLQIEKTDILVIEGIHCLNEKLTEFIPADSKFKIYISALTPLNIDEHNRIPTTDGRLIRRMIRDARTRGASAHDTIERWPSVRRGEDRNIFPYQESADVMFNSSLIYEFPVMKSYAEQLLYGIHEDDPEYQEAKRLLKFFDYFLAVDSNRVPMNSLLKEFIGGSIFKV